MRRQALEYFKTQPSYRLNIAPKVYGRVLEMWLEDKSLNEICKEILESEIGINSVVRFKEYLGLIITTDLNSESLTKDIIMGFIDYVASIYWVLEGDEKFESDFYKRYPEFMAVAKKVLLAEINA